jgi:hypothetical protein
MQCKDIEDAPLLRFIARKQAEKGLWVNTWDFEPPYAELPSNLFRAKMGQLIKRGLLTGCNCGCRGDYEITNKGMNFIANNNTPAIKLLISPKS